MYLPPTRNVIHRWRDVALKCKGRLITDDATLVVVWTPQLPYPILSTAVKQKIFGPVCSSVGDQVALAYQRELPNCASCDRRRPGGDTVAISTMLWWWRYKLQVESTLYHY